VNDFQVKGVLEALVNGRHPGTGGALPADSIVNEANVIRVLITGIAALSARAARDVRRKSAPPSVGKVWSEEEQQQLIHEFSQRKSIADIAEAHGRTVRVIEVRLEIVDLMAAADRTTRDRGSRRP
jgi:hypothetical protein